VIGFVHEHEGLSGDLANLKHQGYDILAFDTPRRVSHITILGTAFKNGKAEYVFYTTRFYPQPLRKFWADRVI